MKLALASGSVACWGIAQHQPPAKVTDPLPPPSWVGMRTTPMVSLHSGQGLGASSVQFWEIQEPSMTIPSPPVGQDLAVDRLPDIGIEVLSQRERQLLLEDRPEELERVDESLRAHHPLLGVLVVEPGFGAVQEHLEALHGGLLPLGHAGEDEQRGDVGAGLLDGPSGLQDVLPASRF